MSLLGTNDAAGGYTNWAGAATNIEWAVDVATNTEFVCVSNGTYYLTNQIVITNAITLYSLKGRDETIVNGNFPTYSNRCFWISNVNALVTGFTITNGYVTNSATTAEGQGSGGGVWLWGGCISNCIITGNTVTNFSVNYSGGGGVYMWRSASARADSCRIEGNKAVSDSTAGLRSGGGGVYLFAGGVLTNCEIIGNYTKTRNSSAWGGGGGVMWLQGSGAGIYNCRIISNVADTISALEAGGGGVYMQPLLAGDMMKDSIIIGNTSYLGSCGGVWLYVGTVRNCLISGNGCGGIYGNGLFMSYKGKVENCTIMENTGSGKAGIYFNHYASGWPGIFVNTIVQSNYSSGQISNWYTSVDSTNLYLTNCCIYPTSFPSLVQSSGCIESSPQVVDSAGGNYRLSPNSPCINAGTNQPSWMTTGVDLDGRKRIQYGTVDIGAYERINKGAIFSVR
ncbi:MAG: right-handed parallel beta-helix repeat-containing protein [Kiritimatiellae bacterium]|nr:right-handed parallel beta-helix repeat-containing protein [Kiritimatiellia bacterium]